MPANPLTVQNIRKAVVELEQTAVAVSVMGTTTRKLREMAGLVEPIVSALVGMRPDVHRVRVDLHRLVHNAKVSSTKPAPASDRIRRMADGLRRVQGLVSKRLGDTEPVFKVGDFEVVNVWGYSKLELARAKNALGDADRQLARAGLPKLAAGKVYLDPDQSSGGFVGYRQADDSLIMDLARPGDAKDVFAALGSRLWRQDFRSGDKDTWGDNTQGVQRFRDAFSGALSGAQLSRDERARLQVTVGIGIAA